MTVINIPAFSGLNILAAPQRIREDEATVAVGCDFRSLDLRAFRGDADTLMGVTNPASIISDGASIFQWDDTTWVGTLGDKSFARSPTFNSDATTGQRVFVADNAGPYTTGSPNEGWNWVQEVEKSNLSNVGMRTNSYFLSSSTRRLGVPKPEPFTDGTISHVDRSGNVTQLTRYTNADSTIQVSNPTALKTGDRIIIDMPGLGDGPFTVTKKTSGTTPVFTLRNSKLAYQGAKVTAGAPPHTAEFYRANHGLAGGEQIIINVIATTSSGFKNKLPSGYNGAIFKVEYLGPDTFSLAYATTDAPFVLTAAAETGDSMRFAVLSAAGDQIDDLANTNVFLQDGKPLQQLVTYAPGTDTISTWQAALDTLTERSYVVTFVNKFGDESEPSEPTKPILVADGDEVTFAKFPVKAASYTGDFVTDGAISLSQYSISGSNFSGAKLRLYRTDSTGTFRLVTTEVDSARELLWSEVASAPDTPITINWVDSYPDSELGEPLSTQGWQIPPRDLNGLLVSPGGSLVGYKGRVVVGSVPYAPYAVPISNRVAFDYNVKGLVATSAGIVVVTDGHPALIVGDDPATWSIQKLEYPYGCVSRRSIVDMGEMAIYASADGLVGVAGAAVEILTRDALKREQWQDLYNPKRIIAAHAEGRYYGITYLEDTNGNVISRKAFMFDPRTRSFVDLTVGTPYPIALYSRLTDDTLLILKSDGKVYGWNRDTGYWVPYTWWSKWFQLTKPDIFGCAQILSPALLANHQVTMTLYGWDGESVVQVCQYTTIDALVNPAGKVYKFDKNVNPFRLPVPDNRYTVYTVKLEGTLPIGQVTIASTMDEIKQL